MRDEHNLSSPHAIRWPSVREVALRSNLNVDFLTFVMCSDLTRLIIVFGVCQFTLGSTKFSFGRVGKVLCRN